MSAPYTRTKSYAASALVDADGIKTSFGSTAAVKTIVPADFNGAILGADASVLDFPRTITISRSSAANQYSVDPIVITGIRGGATVTESLTPENDDGNDTLRGTQAFDVLTSIVIPADASTGGAYTIGVQDICAPKGQSFGGCNLVLDGTLNLQFGEGSGAPTDAIPIVVAVRPFVEVQFTRVLTSSALGSPTAVGLVLYL
jgi:hypothetical protein